MGIDVPELSGIVQDAFTHSSEVRLLLRLSGLTNGENRTRT
jgi:hypothetical protein